MNGPIRAPSFTSGAITADGCTPGANKNRLGCEMLENVRESERRVLAANGERRDRFTKISGHQRRRCLAHFQCRQVSRVSKESNVASPRLGQARCASNSGGMVVPRNKLAAHEGGQLLNR